jgi:hypothetical protein
MNTLRPICKILTACLWQRGLAAGVILFAALIGSGCALINGIRQTDQNYQPPPYVFPPGIHPMSTDGTNSISQ